MASFDKAKVKKVKKGLPRISVGDYKVLTFALPLLPFVMALDAFHDWQYNRLVWRAEKATKVLNAILPKVLEWVEEDNAFYYCTDWNGSILRDAAPLRYKKWVKKYYWKLHDFVEDGYQNPDYDKTVESDVFGDVWIKFTAKEA